MKKKSIVIGSFVGVACITAAVIALIKHVHKEIDELSFNLEQ